MTIRAIQQALIESADLVALAVCRRNTPKEDWVSKRELYRRYSRKWLNYHISRDNLRGIKTGASINSPEMYSILEVEALKKAETIGAELKD